MGIAISDPPQRVNDAHAHRSDSRQQAAGGSHQEREAQPETQSQLRQNQRGQQAVESRAHTWNGSSGKNKSERAADESDYHRFGENQEQHGTIRKSNGLQDGELAGAFAYGNGHGVPSHEEKREENNAADGKDKEFYVAKLLGETGRERGFGLGLSLSRRVGELPVNGLRNADGIIGAIQLQDVPSDLTLDEGRHTFVEIFPLKPELAFIAAGFIAVINAIEIEIPSAVGAVKGVLDGDAIANLPAEALRDLRADNRSLAVLNEVLPLVLRHDELANYLTLVFGVNGKLRKEIFLFDVHTAKPVIVGDGLHARDRQDFVPVCDGHGLNQPDAVGNHQAVSAGNFRAAAESALHHSEKHKENQSDGERADGEDQSDFLAKEIGKDEPAKFHAAPPAMTLCGEDLPSTRTPFSRWRVVCARVATTGSCVTIKTGLRDFPTSSSMSAMISSALLRSRSPVGSSHRRNVGSETMARAMVTRCSWPPESCRG